MIAIESWMSPGPRRFIAHAVRSVRDGKCLVIQVPKSVAEQLESKIRSSLRDICHRVDTVHASYAPMEDIMAVIPELPQCESLPLFLNEIGISPRTFLVIITKDDIWNIWKDFIARFHHAIVKYDQSLRPTIVALIPIDARPLPDEVALECVSWRNVWSDADALALAEDAVPRSKICRDLFELVAIHTIARLAIWDHEIASTAGRRLSEFVFDPQQILLKVALSRGWLSSREACADDGTIGFLNSKIVLHSAWLAISCGNTPQGKAYSEELYKRRWHAQAAVLLPWIEEQRMDLVNLAHRFLPTTVDSEDIMEIGPLSFLLSRTTAPQELKRRASRLKDARNDIAHLRLMSRKSLYELSAIACELPL
jgi:hypothetical protein